MTRIDHEAPRGDRPRTRSIADAGNVRIETLVTPGVARTILEHVMREFSKSSLVAYAHDVDAVGRSRFVS